MTTIDIHAHAIVPAALRLMAEAHADFGPVLYREDDRTYLRYPGRGRWAYCARRFLTPRPVSPTWIARGWISR